MIGYICKYTPVEIFEAFGESVMRIDPVVDNFNNADVLMHANICSYVKGVLEDVLVNDYDAIILTSCCDSVRRLYDTLKHEFPSKFIYILDIPRTKSNMAILLYANKIRKMIKAYEEYSLKKFDEDKLVKVINSKKIQKEEVKYKGNINLGILGSRSSNLILKMLEEKGVNVKYDYTCFGTNRIYQINRVDVIEGYAEALLSQIPCIRMLDYSNRERFIDAFDGEIDGIIYHTVKFCDMYAYENSTIKDRVNVPVLSIETDLTNQSNGQTLTRIEAFLEAIENKKGTKLGKTKNKKENESMYVLGIDSGSTSTNAVIMNELKEIVAFEVVRTGAKSAESAKVILDKVLKKAGLERNDIDLIVSTGYGRVSIPFADINVTEISCHGKGAHYFNKDIRTILDIGGQDSKAIRLNAQGEVIDFAMNDKCAAGTGRFLEMMARTLEISVDELGKQSLNSKEDIVISSMCSVFAESEVISLIAQNKETADIAHGLHNAIATRAFTLMKRVGLEPGFMMTGGVAKNPGVVKAVEEKLNDKLFICDEPEIVGATGAALYGLESLEK